MSILTKDLFGGAGDAPQPVYRPMPMLLHWVEARLFGVAVAPMRLVNVLLHTLNGALLFVWLRRRGVSELAAQVATAVFLLHPSVTEPVMWLSGSHDLLGVLFTLAALLAAPSWWRCAVFCALAFLSKELYAIAPLLVLVTNAEAVKDAWSAKKPAILLPFAGTAAVFALRAALGIPASSGAGSMSDHVRCLGTLLLHYAAQVLGFSNGLTASTYAPLSFGLSLVVVLGFAVAALRSRAAAWFCLAIAPLVIAVETNHLLGNRYAYLPLVAFALLVAAGAGWLEPKLPPRLAPIVAGASLLVAPLLALPTAGEASQWATALSLFGHDVERDPNDREALFHYGNAVVRRDGCGAALPFFERAVTSDPTYQEAWNNLAGCLINERRYDEAVAPAERAHALAPNDPRAERNLRVAKSKRESARD